MCSVKNGTCGPNDKRGGSGSRVTSVQYINDHDVSLVATGADDGAVRVYTQAGSLLTAWQAIQPSTRASYNSTNSKSLHSPSLTVNSHSNLNIELSFLLLCASMNFKGKKCLCWSWNIGLEEQGYLKV